MVKVGDYGVLIWNAEKVWWNDFNNPATTEVLDPQGNSLTNVIDIVFGDGYAWIRTNDTLYVHDLQSLVTHAISFPRPFPRPVCAVLHPCG